MDNEQSQTMVEESRRIEWRQRLMGCGPEGAAWLLHVSKLYKTREQLIGAHHIGLPDSLRVKMDRKGVMDVG